MFPVVAPDRKWSCRTALAQPSCWLSAPTGENIHSEKENISEITLEKCVVVYNHWKLSAVC